MKGEDYSSAVGFAPFACHPPDERPDARAGGGTFLHPTAHQDVDERYSQVSRRDGHSQTKSARSLRTNSLPGQVALRRTRGCVG